MNKISKKTNKFKINKSKKVKNSKLRKGGELINSGGFGCVFKPALKCKGSKTRKPNYISKLGSTKNMNEEFNNFKLVKKLLSQVPNSKKYFLLEMQKCRPSKLSKNDMKNLENCSILDKYNINSTNKYNINQYLDKFEILNIPYGGKDLWHLADNNDLPKYSVLLSKLINLLTNAILEMNKRKIYHFDIKANNILYSKNSPLKLIDYGLLGSSKDNKIPKILLDRRIQFNNPVSCLVFNSDFMKDLLKRLKENKIKKKNKKDIYNTILKTYIDFLHLKNSFGHEGFFANVILPNIEATLDNKIVEELTFYKVVSNYLTDVIFEFLDFSTYKFDDNLYFNKIYSKNVDIYGWIMCFCIYFKDKNYTSKTIDRELQTIVSKVIYKYCISPEYSTKQIPVKELIADLKF